uniref:Sushi domain-containing protein n=1 Tax=Monopterus albus TaxID=43700 RepID=A0A3Q3K3S9_MONAL
MLAVHEASYQEGLRSLRKKISALPNSTMTSKNGDRLTNICFLSVSCPKPEPPTHGRRLGRVFGVGHEVHFLCKPGYELIGPRTQVCLESLKWSGKQPICRRKSDVGTADTAVCLSVSTVVIPVFLFRLQRHCHLPGLLLSCLSSQSTPSPPSSTSSSPSSPVQPSRCTHLLGSTRCTCDIGFTISGRDNNVCTDIDECHVFPLSQPGRLCVHQCVNTPGSFHCFCPAGYDLARDGHGCTGQSSEVILPVNGIVCVNTFGGFQCATVEPQTPFPSTSCLWCPTCLLPVSSSGCRRLACWATHCVSAWQAAKVIPTSVCSALVDRLAPSSW